MSSPTSRYFVTQLLNSLPTAVSLSADDAAAVKSNPLHGVPDAVKKQLLSLQVLFPNELVPALDLLDRKLVTRFRIYDGSQVGATVTEPQRGASETAPVQTQDQVMAEAIHHSELQHDTIYYVRSAQQRSSRFNTSYDTTTCYEVRLQAWNCSCPAFAFSAFPAIHGEPPALECHVFNESNAAVEQADRNSGWIFGGISLGQGMPPVCKHLLACVLAEKCDGLFGEYVEEKDVNVQSAAGWAAGWGD
jgi:hypothetical protein